jgi:ABC-2 type transport system ATP-binding protein
VTSPILRVDGVRKRFGSLTAVDGVSLHVDPGEVFGLLGPNGAGKTTLIRLILDIYRPDEGTVEVFGRPMDRDSLDSIGYLPEERGLYRRRKVIQVLTYLGELKGLRRPDAIAHADAWLRRLGVEHNRDKKLQALSKGNQQTIQLIATLVGDPRLIVWDEPFSGLDPVNVEKVRQLLHELRDAGTTVILSTHRMAQAEALCDRVALVGSGRLVLEGSVDGVLAEYGGGACELETDAVVDGDWDEVESVDRVEHLAGRTRYALRLSGLEPEPLLRRLLAQGSRVHSFRPLRPTLEEVFLRAVEASRAEASP